MPPKRLHHHSPQEPTRRSSRLAALLAQPRHKRTRRSRPPQPHPASHPHRRSLYHHPLLPSLLGADPTIPEPSQPRIHRGGARAKPPGPVQRKLKANLDAWRPLLVTEVATRASAYLPLIRSPSPTSNEVLGALLASFFSSHSHDMIPPPDPLSFAFRLLKSIKTSLPPEFSAAFDERHSKQLARRKSKKDMGSTHVFLYKNPARLDHFRTTVATFYLHRLPEGQEYPPRGCFVAEGVSTQSSWATYIRNSQKPDKRGKRKPVHLLDKSKIAFEIPAGLTCIIRDADTREVVFSVVRNLSGLAPMLAFAKEVIEQAVSERRSIRLEDAGSLVMFGYSAGSRSKPAFAWVKNLLGKRADTTEFNHKAATVLGYAWLRMRALHPGPVIGDFLRFFNRYNIPRLDPNWPAPPRDRGSITLPPGCGGFVYEGAENAPGCAVFGERYARAVHKEKQPHDWALSWTTLRTGNDLRGGNFVLASYGLLVSASQDSSMAWQPADWHTTTLGTFEPTFDIPGHEDETFNQQGIAFVTSPRIKSAYLKWRDANGLSGSERVEAAIQELELEGGEGGEIYE
ncbi:hypothetical protein CC2G_008245 [Coprinopsis cinerea AmutBmut pab1-1]|nr:hypothetical protein CC2G_008245 [Coprinopsis cinerea AmutBmut pab1-1]